MKRLAQLPHPFKLIFGTAFILASCLSLFVFVILDRSGLDQTNLEDIATIVQSNEQAEKREQTQGSWGLFTNTLEVRLDLLPNGAFRLRILDTGNIYRQWASGGVYLIQEGQLVLYQTENTVEITRPRIDIAMNALNFEYLTLTSVNGGLKFKETSKAVGLTQTFIEDIRRAKPSSLNRLGTPLPNPVFAGFRGNQG